MLPYTVYIDPQLGRIGISEEEAREKGYEIKVAKMPMDYVARALEVDESRGLMKAIVDAKTSRSWERPSWVSKAEKSCPCSRLP